MFRSQQLNNYSAGACVSRIQAQRGCVVACFYKFYSKRQCTFPPFIRKANRKTRLVAIRYTVGRQRHFSLEDCRRTSSKRDPAYRWRNTDCINCATSADSNMLPRVLASPANYPASPITFRLSIVTIPNVYSSISASLYDRVISS